MLILSPILQQNGQNATYGGPMGVYLPTEHSYRFYSFFLPRLFEFSLGMVFGAMYFKNEKLVEEFKRLRWFGLDNLQKNLLDFGEFCGSAEAFGVLVFSAVFAPFVVGGDDGNWTCDLDFR